MSKLSHSEPPGLRRKTGGDRLYGCDKSRTQLTSSHFEKERSAKSLQEPKPSPKNPGQPGRETTRATQVRAPAHKETVPSHRTEVNTKFDGVWVSWSASPTGGHLHRIRLRPLPRAPPLHGLLSRASDVHLPLLVFY